MVCPRSCRSAATRRERARSVSGTAPGWAARGERPSVRLTEKITEIPWEDSNQPVPRSNPCGLTPVGGSQLAEEVGHVGGHGTRVSVGPVAGGSVGSAFGNGATDKMKLASTELPDESPAGQITAERKGEDDAKVVT